MPVVWQPLALAIGIALLLRSAAAATTGFFSVGTEQLRFSVSNTTSTQARWGCLRAVHVGGDPQPTENGVLRGGIKTGAASFGKVVDVEPWDGKDGELPEEEPLDSYDDVEIDF